MSDEYYDRAVKLIRESGKATVTHIRTTFKIGQRRAEAIMDAMEFHGIVGAQNGRQPRKILDY